MRALAKSAKISSKATGAQEEKAVTKPGGNGALISDQSRQNRIEVAAYYIAKKRGFQSGSELEDWLQAEKEVDRQL